MPDATPDLPLLELVWRPDLDILVGRWGYQPEAHALPAAYDALTAEALAINAASWLQDIRRRTQNDPQTTRWLLTEYFPDMAQRLGGRLHVAYLVSPALHQNIMGQPGYMPAAGYADQPFAIEFFGDEGAAIQWLREQTITAG